MPIRTLTAVVIALAAALVLPAVSAAQARPAIPCPAANSAGVKCFFSSPEEVIVEGTAGNDTIVGTALREIIRCDEGDDTVTGGAGNDDIRCAGGNDVIAGGSDGDTIAAGDGTTA